MMLTNALCWADDGNRMTLRLDGSRGPVVARMPSAHAPRTDPCLGCEHRRRCPVDASWRPVAEGCPVAEGWRAMEAAYDAPAEQLPLNLTS